MSNKVTIHLYLILLLLFSSLFFQCLNAHKNYLANHAPRGLTLEFTPQTIHVILPTETRVFTAQELKLDFNQEAIDFINFLLIQIKKYKWNHATFYVAPTTPLLNVKNIASSLYDRGIRKVTLFSKEIF